MPLSLCRRTGWVLLLAVLVLQLSLGRADDKSTEQPLWRVEFTPAPQLTAQRIEGRILVEAQDGGILLEDRAGVLWNVTPEQLSNREETNDEYTRMSAEELAAQLRDELGTSVKIITTEHYVIATLGSPLYAEWCGVLFERLLKAFLGYWHSAELELDAPTSPLPVIIYQDRASFAKVAVVDAGAAFAEANGYYSMKTNRVVLFDPIGDRQTSTNRKRPIRTRGDLHRFMAADPTPVSTVVHEATHQIAFNSGMHTRYADNPVWLTEGMAMFFEVPDLRSSPGWRTIGRVNRPRLKRFRESLRSERLPDSLTSLTADDTRYRNPEASEAAYAEAWVFTHYLIKTHRPQYLRYLNLCSEHTQLSWKSDEERLHEFEKAFGVPPSEFEDEMLRYASKLSRR